MKKLSSILAPAVAGCVRAQTRLGAIAEIKNCYYDGADMIDLHLSCLDATDTETLRSIIQSTPLPVLAMNYDQNFDRTRKHQTEEERVASLLRAIEAGAAGVDIEGYTFHAQSEGGFHGENKYSFTVDNPKEVVTDPAVIAMQCDFIEQVHSMGGEVLLSCHPGVPMNTEQVLDLIRFLKERNPDIIKLVTMGYTQEDCDEGVRAMLAIKREFDFPVSYHVTGQAGIPTRMINPLLGGQIAFCIDRFNEGSTMGQLDLRTMRAVVDNARKLL